MKHTDRRTLLGLGLALVATPGTVLGFGSHPNQDTSSRKNEGFANNAPNSNNKTSTSINESSMKIHYLEIVTQDVDEVCATYSQVHEVTFGDANPSLGGARTAELGTGGMLGVRAPMHDAEKPVVRPYFLVSDIEATVAAVGKTGAEVAVPPMKIEGHGTCAIFICNGVETGLWQL